MISVTRKSPANAKQAGAAKKVAKRSVAEPARELPAKKPAAKSSTVTRKAGQAPKFATDSSQAERDAIENWFQRTKSAMTDSAAKLNTQIKMMPSGDEKDRLLEAKGQLLEARTMLDKREEAFFATSGAQLLRPPTNAEIDKTKQLAKGLADAIAEQKTAEAIVKLVTSLVELASKVSSAPVGPASARKAPDKADAVAKAEVQTMTRPKFLRVAKPDAIDFRDRPFMPNVSVTPKVTLFPDYALKVKHQGDSNACTGFGLSLVVEHLLRKSSRESRPGISPFMLYSMARRYDEFPGSVADDGSSLRGALKGWFKHGACSQALFPGLDMPAASSSLDDDWWLDAVKRPLGAYYRIDPRSITDMHAALNEVGILYVSAGCHSGWDEGAQAKSLSRRPTSFKGVWEIPVQGGHAQHPGHAFAVVGYNEAGFLIQNSWGTDWGSYGYAILTYEDWLSNAMDCWVAQLGVVTREHRAIAQSITLRTDTAGKVALASSEVLRNRELSPFVLNLGNNGALSNSGTFRTKPDDVRAMVDVHVAVARKNWKLGDDEPIDVCIYAHGGLVGEKGAADIAALWIPFLYERHVFPVFLMWETDFITTVLNTIEDAVKGVPRSAGWSPSIERWWNQRLERVLARPGTQIWGEMKQNAEAMSAFRPGVEDDQQAGAVLMYRHFKHGVSDKKIRLHVVGHSAGAIVATHMIDRLVEDGMTVESLSLLAPAVTVKDFDKRLRPHLMNGAVKRFQEFHLSDETEEDDPTCGPYRRSLLYLVSESFEGGTTTPLLGMQKYFDAAASDLPRTTVHVSPVARDPNRPDVIPVASTTHGGFDNDPGTQAEVLRFIQGAGGARRRGLVGADEVRVAKSVAGGAARKPLPRP